jgi:hypothetical protein
MTFAKYYGELLRKNESGAPSADEAQKDFQRVVELSYAALNFGA